MIVGRVLLAGAILLTVGSTKAPTAENVTTPASNTTATTSKYKSVCYKYLGCFDNYPPFSNAGGDLPYPPEIINTKTWLYTRANPKTPHVLDYKNTSTFTSFSWNKAKPLKVVIHGFQNEIHSEWMHKIKDGYLQKGDFNVILVGWKKGAEFPNYDQAVANTRVVATQVKLVLETLMEHGLKLDDVHLSGHSLGAHTSGYIGFLMKGRIGRITGMDPAEPDYENLPDVLRLDKADAKFVDTIHTNGAPIFTGGAGLMEISGHVDFYVNGGKTQPGCKSVLGSIFSGGFGKAISCSHSRSHDIYAESITSQCPFTAYPCASYDDFKKGKCMKCGPGGCTQMGYYADQYSARGKMYLVTAAKSPFCGFHYKTSIKTGSRSGTKGRLYLSMSGRRGETKYVPATGDDTIDPLGTVESVFVAPAEVGDLTMLGFKYVKHSGFWVGGGEDSLVVNHVNLTSGESGYNYLFCFGTKVAKHNIPIQATITHRRTCP